MATVVCVVLYTGYCAVMSVILHVYCRLVNVYYVRATTCCVRACAARAACILLALIACSIACVLYVYYMRVPG